MNMNKEKEIKLMCCDAVERLLPIIEERYPEDRKNSRYGIEAIRKFLADEISEDEYDKAKDRCFSTENYTSTVFHNSMMNYLEKFKELSENNALRYSLDSASCWIAKCASGLFDLKVCSDNELKFEQGVHDLLAGCVFAVNFITKSIELIEEYPSNEECKGPYKGFAPDLKAEMKIHEQIIDKLDEETI